MAQLTGIEWTDMSANPIRAVRKDNGKRGHACIHASPGCIHCYSERWNGWRGTGLKFNVPSLSQVDIILDEKELARMRKIKTGNKVFVCDMTDLFGPFVPDEYIAEIFNTMRQNSGVTWQVLTKRPERMAAFFAAWIKPGYVYDNVWLGTSVENQEYADKRIPELLKAPARVRFLSCEPLLGPITFRPRASSTADMLRLMETGEASEPTMLRGIHWMIVGGESGHGARPMHPDWARSLRDQAQAAGVAFFFKQWGEYGPWPEGVPFSERAAVFQWPTTYYNSDKQHFDQRYEAHYRVGKKAAGRLLDGREWMEMPE